MQPLLKISTVMRRLLCIAVACLAVVLCFNSCKLDTAELTVSVMDNSGIPVADRTVYYTNKAALYASLIAPDPIFTDDAIHGLDSLSTNAQGLVIKPILANLTYVFYVRDEGLNEWIVKSVKAKKDEQAIVEFVVNK